MAKKRITIRLIGSESDGGDVRLSEFIERLEAFSEALRRTERALSGRAGVSVYYKIVDLSHKSPATVVIEAVAKADAPVRPEQVVTSFVRGVKEIRKKRPPQKADLPMLESYKALAGPPQKKLRLVELVESRSKVVPIDSAFSQKVEEIIGPDLFSYGTISGRLEKVNFHNVQRFEIYPTVGPRKLTCNFRQDLRKRVKEALDNYVTVAGRLRYKQWDSHPYAIDAKDIDIHQTDQELPTLHDLRGVTTNSTGGMSAEEFVRSIRDANW